MESLLADSNSCTTFSFFFWKQKFWECYEALSIVYVCLKASNSMPQKLKTKFEASPMGMDDQPRHNYKTSFKTACHRIFFFLVG